jgi:CheY-like chemotaxis protein
MAKGEDGAQFNRRVLVVDDQPAIHEDFRKILVGDAEPVELDAMEAAVFGSRSPEPRRIRFDMDSAYQGAEAIEKIRRARADMRPYALVFVDVRMPPGFDGVETLARIFDDDQDIQAVLCTAYADWSWSAVAERIDNEGRFLILKKPFDAAEVRQMAAAMTMKWSEQAALHAAYRRQELLHAVTRLLVRSSSPALCAPEVAQLVGKTMAWPFVALWQRRPDGRNECIGAFAENGDEALTDLRNTTLALDEDARVLPDKRSDSTSYHSGQAIDDDDRSRLITKAGLRGALLVPVRSADHDFGVLELWRWGDVVPDRGEIALLEELCSRMGSCCERTHLMSELVQREASWRALFSALPDTMHYVDRHGRRLEPPYVDGKVIPNLSPVDLLDAVPSSFHARLLELLARVMDTGTVCQFKFSGPGDGRLFDARIAPMFEAAAIVVIREMGNQAPPDGA